MIVRKLRLQRGWSQDQLATLTGLSVRTIQRIEQGQQPGLESLKALASVFELDVTQLQESEMKGNETDSQGTVHVARDEREAMKFVEAVDTPEGGALLLRPVEEALATMSGIKSMNSRANAEGGFASVATRTRRLAGAHAGAPSWRWRRHAQRRSALLQLVPHGRRPSPRRGGAGAQVLACRL